MLVLFVQVCFSSKHVYDRMILFFKSAKVLMIFIFSIDHKLMRIIKFNYFMYIKSIFKKLLNDSHFENNKLAAVYTIC